jgi:hypothetical protein
LGLLIKIIWVNIKLISGQKAKTTNHDITRPVRVFVKSKIKIRNAVIMFNTSEAKILKGEFDLE